MKRKAKKRSYDFSTSARRKLYLLDRPVSQLPTNMLPTIGQVLRYVQFLKSPISNKFQSTLIFAGCSQGRGADLTCKNDTNCQSIHRCATSAVTDIWISAGFEDLILKGKAIKKRIGDLCKKYTSLLNWKRCPKKKGSKSKLSIAEDQFILDSGKLFDISKKDFAKNIRSVKMGCASSKQEDIDFYCDQKGERNMFINLNKPDLDLERSIQVKNIKIGRENKALLDKKLHLEEGARIIENLGGGVESVADDSDSEDPSLTSDDEGDDEVDVSEDDSDAERLDKSFRRRQSQSKAGGEKPKVLLQFIDEHNLINCTAEVAARYKLSNRGYAAMINTLCSAGGMDLDKLGLARESVRRKKFKNIQERGDALRDQITASLKNLKLCLHYDGKQVAHLDEDVNISLTRERIAISVSSPDLSATDDILLAIVECDSAKGTDMADTIIEVLAFYEIKDEQIFAVCCDTTAANTGCHKGANIIISEMLKKHLSWFMCRRHILEVHITHFMTALTGVKTKGPRREIYLRLKDAWSDLKPMLETKLEAEEDMTKFDWNSLTVGSDLHMIALQAREYGMTALRYHTFERDDYRNMVQLSVFYLGGDVNNFQFHQPGACHEARFMADALYILMLRITGKVSGLLKSSAEEKMIETASFFVAIFYSPWFLKSYLVSHAATNDLECFQQALILKKEYPDLGEELLKSMQRHFWYLTQDLVVLALADDDLEKEVLQQMLNKLLEPQNQAPRIYKVRKPILPTISSDTKLPDLLGPESWHLLEVAGVSRSDVQSWAETGVVDKSFVTWVKQLTAVNDCAERNIRLVQDFCYSYKSESQRQNNFQVVKHFRKKLKKDFTISDLKALNND